MRFHFVQQHWNLLDNFDVEAFEGRHFSGMIRQQTNTSQI
jgi:hypothetical protein